MNDDPLLERNGRGGSEAIQDKSEQMAAMS
jgi:hypothetical protein